jgi:hypothetical protein
MSGESLEIDTTGSIDKATKGTVTVIFAETEISNCESDMLCKSTLVNNCDPKDYVSVKCNHGMNAVESCMRRYRNS